MHFDGGRAPHDHGAEEPKEQQRAGCATPAGLPERLRTPVDVHPEHEIPVGRPATRPAPPDDDSDETDDSEDA